MSIADQPTTSTTDMMPFDYSHNIHGRAYLEGVGELLAALLGIGAVLGLFIGQLVGR